MVIHYNNGKQEELIKGVQYIHIVGSGYPIVALLKNDGEVSISLDQIESIFDESLLSNDFMIPKEKKDDEES